MDDSDRIQILVGYLRNIRDQWGQFCDGRNPADCLAEVKELADSALMQPLAARGESGR